MDTATRELLNTMVRDQALAYTDSGMSTELAKLQALQDTAELLGRPALALARELAAAPTLTELYQDFVQGLPTCGGATINTSHLKASEPPVLVKVTAESQRFADLIGVEKGAVIGMAHELPPESTGKAPKSGTVSRLVYNWLKLLPKGQSTSKTFTTEDAMRKVQRSVSGVVRHNLDWGYTDREHPVYFTEAKTLLTPVLGKDGIADQPTGYKLTVKRL